MAAKITSEQIVDALKTITAKCENLDSEIRSITWTAVSVVTNTPTIMDGLKDIISEKTKAINDFNQGKIAIPVDQQSSVGKAIIDFVNVGLPLLRSISDRQPRLSMTPFAAPIAVVLRSNKNADEALWPMLLDYVPTCADDVTPSLESLEKANEQAVDTYSS